MTVWTDHTETYWGGMTPPCQVTQAKFGLLTLQVLQDAYGHYCCHCIGVWRERRLDARTMATAQARACEALRAMIEWAKESVCEEMYLKGVVIG